MRSSVFWTCAGLRVFADFCSIQVRTPYTCHSERSFANAKRTRSRNAVDEVSEAGLSISDFYLRRTAEKKLEILRLRCASLRMRVREVAASTLAADFLARLRQQFFLGPRQASHSLARNLVEQRVDFPGDEFFRRHRVMTFGFGSAL